MRSTHVQKQLTPSTSEHCINKKIFSVLDLDRQMILTKDNITVDIDTCVYYRIVDPKKAYYMMANINVSVSEITYATLRTVCGENTLQDLLEKKTINF